MINSEIVKIARNGILTLLLFCENEGFYRKKMY